MSAILRSGSSRSLAATAAALALTAAACGGSAEPAAGGPTTPARPPADEADSTGSDGAAESTGDEAEASTDRAPDEAAPVENLFPDVDVVNIVDGSTVNLSAELGGGDLPVLLWFWAPH